MNSPSVKSSRVEAREKGTTQRIIEAAERLFGKFGIEAVSIRQVGIEAGVANNSAIAYHFGDRANLVRAIWQHRLPALERARAAMLHDILASAAPPDPARIARVLVMPAYELVDETGAHRYAAFLRQALRWQHGREMRQEMMTLSPSSAQAFAMFRQRFQHLSDDQFGWRCGSATGLFLDLVFDRDHDPAFRQAFVSEQAFLDDAIALLVACCAA